MKLTTGYAFGDLPLIGASCDGGYCDDTATGLRFWPSYGWLPVCDLHGWRGWVRGE